MVARANAPSIRLAPVAGAAVRDRLRHEVEVGVGRARTARSLREPGLHARVAEEEVAPPDVAVEEASEVPHEVPREEPGDVVAVVRGEDERRDHVHVDPLLAGEARHARDGGEQELSEWGVPRRAPGAPALPPDTLEERPQRVLR